MTANPRRPGAEPQTRAAEARRDAQGRMLPGTTPNPGGRPRVWREFQEAMRDRTPRAIEVVDAALGSEEEERRWAAEQALAYAWGKSPARGRHEQDSRRTTNSACRS